MEEFKNFIHFALCVIVAILTAIVSWGCGAYGVAQHQTYYVVLAVLNLGWLYIPGRYIVKVIKAHLKPAE